MMRTAAVILNYNDAEASIRAVERIRSFRSIDNVIVVDNASTDGDTWKIGQYLDELNAEQDKASGQHADKKKKECQRYMLVLSDKNGGYGYGNNIGVRYAYEVLGADLCLIANPDSEFGERTVNALRACFEDKNVAAAGAVMRSDAHKKGYGYNELISSAWPLRGFAGELLDSGPISRRLFRPFLNYPPSYFKGKKRAEAGCIHGSLLMVECESFLAAGGYDEEMFLYHEEDVLGQKLRRMGLRTVLSLSGSYIHEGAGSTGKEWASSLRRNSLRQQSERYYYRHYLGAGPIAMAAAFIFQMIVQLETFLYEKFSGK